MAESKRYEKNTQTFPYPSCLCILFAGGRPSIERKVFNFVVDYINSVTKIWNRVDTGYEWVDHPGQKMINKVASTIQVDRSLQCMMSCSMSPICDSFNYHADDKTCQLNTHDTPLIASSTDIVADNAWIWWSPIFCTVV